MASASGILSSLLLGDAKATDDDLFARSKGATSSFQPLKPSAVAPRKPRQPAATASTSRLDDDESSEQDSSASSSDEESSDEALTVQDQAERAALLKAKAFSKQLKLAKKAKSQKPTKKRKAEEIEVPELEPSEDELDEMDEDEPDLEEHEERTPKRTEEQERERNSRTLFIGNVPTICATSKSSKKALIRHFVSHDQVLQSLPKGTKLKCDSIRFRSLAFASTIFGRPEKDVEAQDVSHAAKRAKMWKDAAVPDESIVVAKKGMSDAQKRRAAAIKRELNDKKKNCNAYLVLSVEPGEQTSAIVDLVIAKTHNSVFEGLTLRVDRASSRLSAVSKSDKGLSKEEARRTIFLGGLDFAETEENVRQAVQLALAQQRQEEDTQYVDDVRIVRDNASGLGKGFAYVRFIDERSVDELLALPVGKPLKISKRKVRLERCKTRSAALASKLKSSSSGSATTSKGANNKKDDKSRTRKRRDVDPALLASLAEKKGPSKHQEELASTLKSLDKDERKKVKSIDPERVARRMAKKQAKVLKIQEERQKPQVDGTANKKELLGRESRREKRHRQEKKRVKKH